MGKGCRQMKESMIRRGERQDSIGRAVTVTAGTQHLPLSASTLWTSIAPAVWRCQDRSLDDWFSPANASARPLQPPRTLISGPFASFSSPSC